MRELRRGKSNKGRSKTDKFNHDYNLHRYFHNSCLQSKTQSLERFRWFARKRILCPFHRCCLGSHLFLKLLHFLLLLDLKTVIIFEFPASSCELLLRLSHRRGSFRLLGISLLLKLFDLLYIHLLLLRQPFLSVLKNLLLLPQPFSCLVSLFLFLLLQKPFLLGLLCEPLLLQFLFFGASELCSQQFLFVLIL
jgi:hypothetical protein